MERIHLTFIGSHLNDQPAGTDMDHRYTTGLFRFVSEHRPPLHFYVADIDGHLIAICIIRCFLVSRDSCA